MPGSADESCILTQLHFNSASDNKIVGRSIEHRLTAFTDDLRQVLRRFLIDNFTEIDDFDDVTDLVVEGFLDESSIRSWRWTMRYRHLVLNILRETVANQLNETRESESFTKLFSIAWRKHLLAQSWQRMRQKQAETGWPYFTVLDCRYRKPWLTNRDLLQEISGVLKSHPTKQTFRVFLYRCERRFAREVFTAVLNTIHLPTPEAIQSELSALDLLQYSLN